MKAMVVRELGGGWVPEEITIAKPQGNEVLVDIKASGLCGSDQMEMSTEVQFPPPSVLGHEIAGIVTEIGPNVTNIAVGDHVAACLVQFCGKCEECLSDDVGLCLNPSATERAEGEAPRLTDSDGKALNQGMGLGGFAQQALVHENMLVTIPKEMPFPQAAVLGCGVVTGTGAIFNAAQVEQGATVAIIGAGGVGLNAISGAVVAGAAKIIVIDLNNETLETAKKFGATHIINSGEQDPVAAVKDLTGGRGVPYAFDIVGITPTARQGYDMLAKGGTLYQIGMGGGNLELANLGNIFDRKAIQGVFMGSGVPKRDIPVLADLYLQGKLNLDDLVSAEISLSEVNEGYEKLKDPQVNRVVITSFE
ncbi:MAG: Zn-dependent alcohol dehydrogenase [Yaniella sp.]|uniref:Zn-dependent alcohol dehydrogenase n=1 Tax=Yaniella sp. TaxID=2773929 RepID=UPI0026478B2F|nr:Zn-dependent alcohol dehydrogenase [Yaniella sp.]MDN5732300.1 Zn-dependent alcohol dehydrogenase [Yaniella sp.]MDN5816192.1 Zn-dependent alcohol dehydrogenase [Yaniella sp.]MDN5818029.1 Zn-dependent alcohol dehydrogenase [Yaniella sp.]MDN5913018.1 Zn-dependent alcohol dehydrogenase [Yaniella sp.]MDN6149231.1 Zn-dependent alcohol dehydrogenase [Yaniella sp.]